jgi:transmembrane sensor
MDDLHDRYERAARAFLGRHQGESADAPATTDVAEHVARAWQAVGLHASAPEVIAMRAHALARVHSPGSSQPAQSFNPARQRWLRNAMAACMMILLGTTWELSPFQFTPGTYRTGVGELRTIQLEDRSRMDLDAQTRVRVRFSPRARRVDLIDGQAQFSVAKDPQRPFTVHAGNHVIVAVGTSFSVEYVDQQIRVAMIEGRVLVKVETDKAAASQASAGQVASAGIAGARELVAGDALRVSADGTATFTADANVDAFIAWRQGKVVFDSEPLAEAVRRLNRYSQLQIEIMDPALADIRVGGVFEMGDSVEFTRALEATLPLTADYSSGNVIRLYRRYEAGRHEAGRYDGGG